MMICRIIQKFAELLEHSIAHNLLHSAIKGGRMARTAHHFQFLQEILVSNRPMSRYSKGTFDSTLFGWAYLSHLIKVQLPIGRNGTELAPFAESLHCHLIVSIPKVSLIQPWSSRLESKTLCNRTQLDKSFGKNNQCQMVLNLNQYYEYKCGLPVYMLYLNIIYKYMIYMIIIYTSYMLHILESYTVCQIVQIIDMLKDLTWLY